MIPSIEFRGVSKFFGNIIALKDISFKVFKGEITALLGDCLLYTSDAADDA